MEPLADTAMHREEGAVDAGSHWQRIEEFHEAVVDLKIIVLDALLAEVEVACALSCFVITAQ